MTGTSYITHQVLASFADERVNLKRDDVSDLREQANRLRDRVQKFINEHEDYSLVKILQAGSLRKGTALKSLNDIDFAAYVRSGDDVPTDEIQFLDWLAQRLREANPNMAPEQIQPATHCVKIDYRGTGLSVDIGPVHYCRRRFDDAVILPV